MKKLFILSSFLGFALSNAQLVLKKHDGTVINDNTTFAFNTYDDLASKIYITAYNTSSSESIRVKMVCEELINSEGDQFQFCFGGLCMPFIFTDVEYPSDGKIILPGGNTGNADFLWNQRDYDAPMSAKFRFYQVDSDDNPIGTPIHVTYVYDKALAVSDVNLKKDVIVKNTLVDTSLELNSKINTSFQLYDMNSKLVINSELKAGDNTINIGALPKGTYILNIKNSNGKNQMQKIIKK